MASAPPPRFGLNLNNRAPLLNPAYGLDALLDLGARAEALGFDSLWVGDSLFSKPRHEPLALLAALSQRTSRVRLGTACLVTPLREPLQLALAWATLDVLAGGRTILGACAGNLEEGVRREFAALGLSYERRFSRFEEGLHVLRQLWTQGRVSFHGRHLDYDDVAFSSGVEAEPLRPPQRPPPIWIVSNPRIAEREARPGARARAVRAGERILRCGDGWLTCCRASHPEEVEDQLRLLAELAPGLGVDHRRLVVAYQVTLNVGPSREAAREDLGRYIAAYYPEFGARVDLDDWGPGGTAADVRGWLERFAAAGVGHFVCRFGSLDQVGQLERFAQEVLPCFRTPSPSLPRRAGEGASP